MCKPGPPWVQNDPKLLKIGTMEVLKRMAAYLHEAFNQECNLWWLISSTGQERGQWLHWCDNKLEPNQMQISAVQIIILYKYHYTD